jgi:hypothetical protein
VGIIDWNFKFRVLYSRKQTCQEVNWRMLFVGNISCYRIATDVKIIAAKTCPFEPR